MDDLISRQAAIDAITARADRCAENFSTDDPFWEGLVIKDLPEELIAVNVTWVNHDPAPYNRGTKDKRFVDTAVYYQGDWYWWDVVLVDVLKEYGNSRVTCIDSEIEIIAWKPLPEPWEGEQNECEDL